jgi:hypothetical protein
VLLKRKENSAPRDSTRKLKKNLSHFNLLDLQFSQYEQTQGGSAPSVSTGRRSVRSHARQQIGARNIPQSRGFRTSGPTHGNRPNTCTPTAPNVMAVTSSKLHRMPAWNTAGAGGEWREFGANSSPPLGAAMNASPSGNEPPFLRFMAILVLVWLAASAIVLGRYHLF